MVQGTDRALLSEVSSAEYAFLESLKISKLRFTNFFACYQALIERVVAVKCAKHSGVFSIEKPDDSSQKTSSIVRLARLRELEQLDAQRSEILRVVIDTRIAKTLLSPHIFSHSKSI